MVGILLNSRLPRELRREPGDCLEGLDDENELGRGRVRIVDGGPSADPRSYNFRTGFDSNKEVYGNP
jgi:hypothetical protein